jgi:hypothetical protein
VNTRGTHVLLICFWWAVLFLCGCHVACFADYFIHLCSGTKSIRKYCERFIVLIKYSTKYIYYFSFASSPQGLLTLLIPISAWTHKLLFKVVFPDGLYRCEVLYVTLKNNVNYKYYKIRWSGKYLDPRCLSIWANLECWIMSFFTISLLSCYYKPIKEFTVVWTCSSIVRYKKATHNFVMASTWQNLSCDSDMSDSR